MGCPFFPEKDLFSASFFVFLSEINLAKKGSWVGGSRTLLGLREQREWGPDSGDSGKSELEALTPGLGEEGLGAWTPGSEGGRAGGPDPRV